MATHYKWSPLVDLPDDPSALTDSELDALHRVWTEQSQGLAAAEVLDEFNARLAREWAIETGVIEGVYTVDRGVTRLLIGRGIQASLISRESAGGDDPERVARIIQDHVEVLEELFAFVKGERSLTAGYIKELHAALLRHQDTVIGVDQFGNKVQKRLEKGLYKTHPNNPTRTNGTIHEYCPPEHVASEMNRMISLHQGHGNRGVPTEVEAAWLHHVFTQIHPFEDGNGRVARAIATVIFLKDGWFPLVITRDDRGKYIEALETADRGDLLPLVSLLAQMEKREFLSAIEAAYQVKPPQTVDEAITAVGHRLIQTGQGIPNEWNRAKETAARLFGVAVRRMADINRKLSSEVASAGPSFEFSSAQGGGAPSKEVRDAVGQLPYTANFNDYHVWAQLYLKTQRTAAIVVSFHAVGEKFHGLVAASIFFFVEGTPANLASDEMFQINYLEDPAQVEKRFGPWLERGLVKGLALWRSQL